MVALATLTSAALAALAALVIATVGDILFGMGTLGTALVIAPNPINSPAVANGSVVIPSHAPRPIPYTPTAIAAGIISRRSFITSSPPGIIPTVSIAVAGALIATPTASLRTGSVDSIIGAGAYLAIPVGRPIPRSNKGSNPLMRSATPAAFSYHSCDNADISVALAACLAVYRSAPAAICARRTSAGNATNSLASRTFSAAGLTTLSRTFRTAGRTARTTRRRTAARRSAARTGDGVTGSLRTTALWTAARRAAARSYEMTGIRALIQDLMSPIAMIYSCRDCCLIARTMTYKKGTATKEKTIYPHIL